MNPLQTNMLNALVGAAIAVGALGAAQPARAESFAQSILVIDKLRLLHPNGAPLTAAELDALSGASMALAGGQLNGQFANGMQAGDPTGVNDIARQTVGAATGLAENDFGRRPLAVGAVGNLGSADQALRGALVATDAASAGALVQTRADAALAGPGAAAGIAAVGGATTFSFALGADEFLTIAFDALAFTQAYADADGVANAQLAWSISVLDVTSGETVFTYQPEQLNGMSNVGISGAAGGVSSYDPGLMSFSATTGLLAAGDIYQVTIAQSSFAGASARQLVAEPATLAVFGTGLLAMAALGRRRRRGSA